MMLNQRLKKQKLKNRKCVEQLTWISFQFNRLCCARQMYMFYVKNSELNINKESKIKRFRELGVYF